MGQTKERLRATRLKKGITQEALAEAASTPQKSISNLEKHGPARAVLNVLKIARALDTTVEELFGGYLDKTARPSRKRTVVHSPAVNG